MTSSDKLVKNTFYNAYKYDTTVDKTQSNNQIAFHCYESHYFLSGSKNAKNVHNNMLSLLIFRPRFNSTSDMQCVSRNFQCISVPYG